MLARNIAVAAITALYPLAVYFGLDVLEPSWLAGLLFVIALLRAIASPDIFWRYAAGFTFLLAAAAVIFNDAMPLKLYPVLVSVSMLSIFAMSLRFPPTVIERLARLKDPEFPEAAVAYTRKVTWVWCAFFVFNAGVSLVTAVYASDAIWTLYNGLISYVLMGCLFLGEWLVRPKRQRVQHD